MNITEMITNAHKLKAEAEEQLRAASLTNSELGIAIQDHYSKPRLSVYSTTDVANSAEFELGQDGEIHPIDPEKYDGCLDQAEQFLRAALSSGNAHRTGCWNPTAKHCDCPACGGFND